MKEEGEKSLIKETTPYLFKKIQQSTTIGQQTTNYYATTRLSFFFYRKSHKNCDTPLQWGCQGFFQVCQA